MTGAIPSRLLRIFSSYFVLARIVRDYFLTSSRGRVVFCNTARVSWLLLLYRVQRPWRIHMHVSPTQAHTQTFSPTRTYTYPHARTLHTHTRQNLHTPNTHTHTHTHTRKRTHTHTRTHAHANAHARKKNTDTGTLASTYTQTCTQELWRQCPYSAQQGPLPCRSCC